MSGLQEWGQTGGCLRVWSQISNTVGLFADAMDRTIYMLWKDGLLFRRKTWSQGFRFLFGREGLLRGLGRDYVAWYRRDFHPNQQDDSELIELYADPRALTRWPSGRRWHGWLQDGRYLTRVAAGETA